MRYSADVVFTRAKIAVFVDGCYWHGCPEHFVAPKTNVGYWGPKIAKNQRRDAEFDRLLKDTGWTVVREWEHVEPADIADRVEAAMRPQRLSVMPAADSTSR